MCGNTGLLGGGASEAHSSGPGGDTRDNGSSRHSGGREAGGGQLEAVQTKRVKDWAGSMEESTREKPSEGSQDPGLVLGSR